MILIRRRTGTALYIKHTDAPRPWPGEAAKVKQRGQSKEPPEETAPKIFLSTTPKKLFKTMTTYFLYSDTHLGN